MKIDVVTIFPDAFGALDLSVIGRARERGLLEVRIWDLRDFTTDRHRQVDDAPYGGGAGMVMKVEPFFAAVEAIRAQRGGPASRLILTSPQGRALTQDLARELAGAEPTGVQTLTAGQSFQVTESELLEYRTAHLPPQRRGGFTAKSGQTPSSQTPEKRG